MDGHASVAFGIQSQSVSRTLVSGAVVSQSASTGLFSFAFGANLRLGPGRVLAQVQMNATGKNVAGLAGSLGGVQLIAGYLMTVR